MIMDFIKEYQSLGYSGMTLILMSVLLVRFFEKSKVISEKEHQLKKEYWSDIAEMVRGIQKEVKKVSYDRCEAIAKARIESLDSTIAGLEAYINELHSQLSKVNVIEGSLVDDFKVICTDCKKPIDNILENRVKKALYLSEIVNSTKGQIREHKKEREKVLKDLDNIESVLIRSLLEQHNEILTELKGERYLGKEPQTIKSYISRVSEALLSHNRDRIKSDLNPKSIFYDSDEKRYTINEVITQFTKIVEYVLEENVKLKVKLNELYSENNLLPFGLEKFILFWRKND